MIINGGTCRKPCDVNCKCSSCCIRRSRSNYMIETSCIWSSTTRCSPPSITCIIITRCNRRTKNRIISSNCCCCICNVSRCRSSNYRIASRCKSRSRCSIRSSTTICSIHRIIISSTRRYCSTILSPRTSRKWRGK